MVCSKPDGQKIIGLADGSGGNVSLGRLQELYLRTNLGDGSRSFPQVDQLSPGQKKRIVVTGGAGFVGSYLVDRLMLLGHEVIVLDNFHTGSKHNIGHWLGHPNFELIRHDVVEPINLECDLVYHLACPASPPAYQFDAIRTIKTSVVGTMNMLELARQNRARFLFTSTSEVYGDPEIHPQGEDYWGHVNPIGIRACYDEGKRCAEALCYNYERQHGLVVRVARIFNTYGPRMAESDGRVVTNFLTQALRGDPITVYGDGKQTRSFQYIHDLVTGLIALMNSEHSCPVNLGNPEEYPILDFAHIIKELTNSPSSIVHVEKPDDDPQLRRPNIDRAKKLLGWEPKYTLQQGLAETLEYFQHLVNKN